MENLPFFYYDIIARIIPGALLIASLRSAGAKLPSEWAWVFQGAEAWKNLVAALVCAGAAYMIGVLMEVVFSSPLDLLSRKAFESAFQSYEWRKSWFRPALKGEDYVKYRRHLWNWLTLKGAHDPRAFAHAHRFQAETRLCCYSVLPALIFTGSAIYQGRICDLCRWSCSWPALAGTAFTLLLVCGAYLREWRRWVQALVSADHFGFRWPRAAPRARAYRPE